MKRILLVLLLSLASVCGAETIPNNLLSLDQAKTDIGAAIASKGQSVTGLTFTRYDEAIASISAGAASEPWQETYSGVSWTTATESAPFATASLSEWVGDWTEYAAYTASETIIANSMGLNSFWGGILTASGDVAMVPRYANNWVIYNHTTKQLETKMAHGVTEPVAQGAVLAPNGRIITCSANSGNIIAYDPVTNTATATSHSQGAGAFMGGCVLPSGKILLCPAYSDQICIFDPVALSIAVGPTHGQPSAAGNGAFTGAVLTGSNTVILTPNYADNVGIYDCSTGLYHNGVAHGIADGGFMGGGVLLPDGRIIFAPAAAAAIGIFTPDGIASGSWANGVAHGEGSLAFGGACMLPNQQIVLTPYSSDYACLYNWQTNTITRWIYNPVPGDVAPYIGSPLLLEDGTLVFTPYGNTNITPVLTVGTQFRDINLSNLTHPINNKF